MSGKTSISAGYKELTQNYWVILQFKRGQSAVYMHRLRFIRGMVFYRISGNLGAYR